MRYGYKIVVCLLIFVSSVKGQMIENFETAATWMWGPWVQSGAGGAGVKDVASMHGGVYGWDASIASPWPWFYRTDYTVGAAGDVVGVWAKGNQRNYMGFSAGPGGCWSLVLAPNTSGLIIQNNSGYGYTDLATAPYTYNTSAWYYLQLTYNTPTSVTGKLYDATMVLQTSISTSPPGLVSGGVAFRSFCTSVCYFDDFSLNLIPLPITLLEFTGTENTTDHTTDLNWTTGSEKNNKYFSVERSLDGVNFESLGLLPGAGNSNIIKEYSFKDTKPFTGINYYRLRQVDYDGNYTLSKVNMITVDVKNASNNGVLIFPTISSGVFNLQMPTADGDQTINVSDLTGKVVHTFNINTANNTVSQVDLSILNSGFYMISCHNNNTYWNEKIFVAK